MSNKEMSENMMGAIRAVINFARFDQRYAQMEKSPLRPAYFEKKFAEISAEWEVESAELRSWLQELYKGDPDTVEAIDYVSSRSTAGPKL